METRHVTPAKSAPSKSQGLTEHDYETASWYVKTSNRVLDMASKFTDSTQKHKAQSYAESLLDKAMKQIGMSEPAKPNNYTNPRGTSR